MLVAMLTALCASATPIDDFAASKAINAPQTAVIVFDLKEGREILRMNGDTPLIPASIMKCVTTATLLQKTNHSFRYETPVFFTGEVHDGVLDGNLIIRASGDPSINTGHEPGSENFVAEIVEALKRDGISQIRGRVTIDEKEFPGPAVNPTWMSGDLPHAYGTGTHGFNFEDNALGKKSVKDPAGVFAARLNSALAREGISIDGESIPDKGKYRLLTIHKSAEIDEIMRSCMMRSDNQFAEAMLRTVARESGLPGSTAEGAKEEMAHWKRNKADMEGVNIVDGSGLSRSNRVTAEFMTDVLKQMARNPYYASFFPLAGQEGTLKRFLEDTPLDSYIAMKTGSMKGIQCYAGYKLDEDYVPTHVVVVMMNEMENRAAARAEVERLLLATFGYGEEVKR